jgi:hypothetical protein
VNVIASPWLRPYTSSPNVKVTSPVKIWRFPDEPFKVGTFFKSIYNKILGWLKAGVKWLKDAATTAAQWASSAVSTVKKFFGSLF